ncbi:MAG: tetratricopeptide repeat protein [Cyanobacteria bacterium]|nr:tetratricopeptide repeat protein [Cyanobacteriota bacterium]
MSSSATDTQTEAKATKSSFSLWKAVVIVVVVILTAYLTFQATSRQATPLMQAIKLIKQGKAATAVPILEKLSREEPDNSDVYPWLAQGYLATERYAEGRTALDTTLRLKIDPESIASVVHAYVSYYQRRGDFDEAEKLYRSANAGLPPHFFDKGRATLYLSWSEANITNNNLVEAVHHLQLADSLSSQLPKDVRAKIPQKLSDCYRRLAAIAEMEKKDDSEAIDLLEKSLNVLDEPLTRIALASIYARTGKTKKAIENYQSVCEADPNNLEVRHALIDLLLENRDFNKAQEALLQLTDREKSVENFELLADVNLKLGNYAGAVRALEEASVLRPTVPLLEKLKSALLSWAELLSSERKKEEASSVEGHADRVAEQIAMLKKELGEDKEEEAEQTEWDASKCPVSILFSRNWLVKGSLTPEGKLKIKNISGEQVDELSLAAVFYDNTTRKSYGTVHMPVATPTSPPLELDAERWLYFSCPQTVRIDHQLAVVILWKGQFLREFPVVKR